MGDSIVVHIELPFHETATAERIVCTLLSPFFTLIPLVQRTNGVTSVNSYFTLETTVTYVKQVQDAGLAMKRLGRQQAGAVPRGVRQAGEGPVGHRQ